MARNNGAKWRKIADIDPLAHKPALCRCIHSAYWRTRSSFDFISPALGSISAILCQRGVRASPLAFPHIYQDLTVRAFAYVHLTDFTELCVSHGKLFATLTHTCHQA